ncbi:MAG: TrkA family potassium uptake protein [Thermomicrobiales bacterium]|nr:TrkA family potassium uptake protein [Thermomicrobiales bacterium]
MYVIVVGGGKVGFYLTKTLLSEGYEVLLIERTAEKAERFQEQFGAVVIAGDGAEAQTLKAAGAGRADVVIAVTGEDEDNLVVCQMAKLEYDVGKTIARVNNPKNEPIFKMLGIDVTVSHTAHIMNIIEQAIPEAPVIHLMNLQHPDLAIVDLKVGEESPVNGVALGDVELPPDCIIAAILRGPDLIIPSGDTELLDGDDVIAIAHSDQEAALRRLLV